MGIVNKDYQKYLPQKKSTADPYDIMPKLTATTIPAKAKETLTKTENALLRRIGRALNVPVGVQLSPSRKNRQ